MLFADNGKRKTENSKSYASSRFAWATNRPGPRREGGENRLSRKDSVEWGKGSDMRNQRVPSPMDPGRGGRKQTALESLKEGTSERAKIVVSRLVI